MFTAKETMSPILLHNLSLFSNYRYLFLCVVTTFFLIAWCFSWFFPPVKEIINIISYPYMKEEIRHILYTWNDGFMGNACNHVYTKIITSSFFSIIFFVIHFFCFYFLRFIVGCLLFSFVFFNGNLIWIFYLLPFSFFIWLISFLDYYFKYFREGTTNYILDILEIHYKKSLENNGYIQDFVIVNNINDFEFKLTPFAFKQGYTQVNLDYLINVWYESSQIDLKFKTYAKSLTFFEFNAVFMLDYYFLQLSLYWFR